MFGRYDKTTLFTISPVILKRRLIYPERQKEFKSEKQPIVFSFWLSAVPSSTTHLKLIFIIPH